MSTPETIETIMARRSVRKYDPTPVSDGDLKTILEAARQAPSAGNRQKYHLVVVRDAVLKRQLAQAARNQMWFADADVVIVGAALPTESSVWPIVDTTIALQSLILAATALGYGTCWIGAHGDEAIKKLVNLPAEATVVALTPVGRPADSPDAKPRTTNEQLFSLNSYGGKL
jgi:nitroreductase